MKIDSFSNQQTYVLIELWDSENENGGKPVNIRASEVIRGYYRCEKITPEQRVITFNSLKRLIKRGLLSKEKLVYSLTEEGRTS